MGIKGNQVYSRHRLMTWEGLLSQRGAADQHLSRETDLVGGKVEGEGFQSINCLVQVKRVYERRQKTKHTAASTG
jgi:hypothetical protein